MPLIQHPGLPWTSQPQRLVTPNPLSQLADGVQLLFLPSLSNSLIDVVNPSRVWTPAGNAHLVSTSKGVAASFDGVGDYYSHTGYPEITGATGTFFIWLARVDASSTYGVILFGTASGVSQYFQVAPDGTIYNFKSVGTGTISNFFNSTNTSLVFSSGGSAATLTLYQNGANSGVTFASGPGAWPSGNKLFNFGQYSGNHSVNGDIVVAGYSSKPWTAEMAAAFHANPWQVFRPIPRNIWVASAGGGSFSIPDTGSGSDTISISVACALSDTCAGNDLPSPSAALTLLDDGASADSVSLAALLAVADTGAGSDAATITVAFALVDSGSGADDISVLTQLLVSVSDAASGVDGVSIQAQIALADSGSGADTPVLYISLSVADTASGADALSVLQQLLISVADIASGADSLSLGAGLAVTDAGSGLEGMAIAINVPVGDAGSGTDAPSIQAWLALVESATGMDAAVAFDSARRIATILFKLAHRAMTFTLATRQISFTLN